MLGYRDSGMAGSESNDDPLSFAQAPLDEAVERLVAVIRRARPQVMVDLRRRPVGLPAPRPPARPRGRAGRLLRGGRSGRYPEAGPAWQPAKLYYTVFSAARFREIHEKFEELGLESPFDERWRKRWEDIPAETDHHVRRHRRTSPTCAAQALLAHATQVDPKSPFWFGLPPEVMRSIHPSTTTGWRRGRSRRRRAGATATRRRDRGRSLCRHRRSGSPLGLTGAGSAAGRVRSVACRRGPARAGDREECRDQVAVQEWFDETRALAAELLGPPGLSARIQFEITGGPDGDVSYHCVLEDGRLRSSARGRIADPDVTLTIGWDDAVAIAAGELDPNVAFMQGRMKVAGSMAVMLALLAPRRPSTRSSPADRRGHRRLIS